jgi:DNA-binding beta-propeller fold protein YncE
MALFLTLTAISSLFADPASFLHPEEDVPLTGGVSRFDYQSLDTQSGFLYLAHTGAGQIVVFNTHLGKVAATLSGFPGVTGLLALPQYHRLYASLTNSHVVAVIDTVGQKTVARIPAGHFPDGLTYVPETHEAYVADELGGEVTVFDVLNNRKTASIKMEGQVGNVRYDPLSRRVFANIQTKNELVAIDTVTHKVILHYVLQGGKHPHGLWIDPPSRMAFVACDGDAKLVVMDLSTFQETGVASVGKDPDILSFDDNLGYLYVACDSGVVSIFRVRDHKVEKLGDFPVGLKAHSVEVDPKTHLVYFPLAKAGKGPVLRIMKPAN